jgi:DNA invertase Pin-like site-specific DNA recombinase
MRNTNTAVAVGYIRVSTDAQHLGPEAQKNTIAEWSHANKIRVIASFEEHVSGKTPIYERPELVKLLDFVSVNEVDYVVVSSRDRMSRDMLQMCLLERELTSRKCRLVTATEDPFAAVDDQAQFMKHILDAVSAYERARISTRTKDALAAKKRQGVKLGRPSVFNTRWGKVILNRILRLRENGMSLQEIANILNNSRVAAPSSSGHWFRTTVNRFLQHADKEGIKYDPRRRMEPVILPRTDEEKYQVKLVGKDLTKQLALDRLDELTKGLK